MRLQDCDLSIDAVMFRDAVIRDSAEPVWRAAWNDSRIPDSLFRLYTEADYLSLDKAPRYLEDPDRILFSYYAMLLNGLRESIAETNELLDEVKSWEEQVYSPLTQTGDLAAGGKQRRAFRYLLLNLSSSLDLLAELLALFFTGDVGPIRVGKASSTGLFRWIAEPLTPLQNELQSPRDHHRQKLHRTLRPYTLRQPPEGDWHELLTLYRNKLSHLGGSTVMDFRLHDDQGRFYAFLPREWPFTWQKHIRFGEDAPVDHQTARSNTVALIRRTCIHIDIVEYSELLSRRITAILDSALDILVEAYHDLRDFPSNQAALSELERETRSCSFTEFVDDPA